MLLHLKIRLINTLLKKGANLLLLLSYLMYEACKTIAKPINLLYVMSLWIAYPTLFFRNLQELWQISLNKSNEKEKLGSILDLQNSAGFLKQIKKLYTQPLSTNVFTEFNQGLRLLTTELAHFSTWDHSYAALLKTGAGQLHRLMSLSGRVFSFYNNFQREYHPFDKSLHSFNYKSFFSPPPYKGRFSITPQSFGQLLNVVLTFSILMAQLSFDWSKLGKVAPTLPLQKDDPTLALHKDKIPSYIQNKGIAANLSFLLYFSSQFFTLVKGCVTVYTEWGYITAKLHLLRKVFSDWVHYSKYDNKLARSLASQLSNSPIISQSRRIRGRGQTPEEAEQLERNYMIQLVSSASFDANQPRRTSINSEEQHRQRLENYKKLYKNEIRNLLISFGALCSGYNDICSALNSPYDYNPDKDAVLPSWLYEGYLAQKELLVQRLSRTGSASLPAALAPLPAALAPLPAVF